MKKLEKLLMIILFFSCTLLLFTVKNYAVESSNNANLTTLGIKPAQYDFTGFNNSTLEYSAKVPENVNSVEVFAKVQDPKAIITGTGKRTLEMGKNELKVIVTAQDGTQKTFTINVTRGEEIVDREGLKTLSIKNATLSPTFEATTYEYTAKYIGEEEKLEITAEPTQSDYIVEITGNENLQEGENVITILVSDSSGKNISTYQITVNKSLIDTEAIAKQEAEENRKKITIAGIIGGIIIFAIIVFLIIKRKKGHEIQEENSVDSTDNDDNKQNNYGENELPKALKNDQDTEYTEDEEDYEKIYKEMPKEKIKEKFLNNYQNYEEHYDTENKKRKGKRFK